MVHVGLSLPPVSWNPMPESTEAKSVSLNNNSLTAQAAMEITDVTVDGPPVPLTMLRTTVLPLKANILTELSTKTVRETEETSTSHLTLKLQAAMV